MALGALWSRVTGGLVAFALGGATSRAFRPTFELVEQESWQLNANRVLDVGTLARLVATAVTSEAGAVSHAERSGYNANKLAALVQLALSAPPVAQALDMLRRGEISREQFRHALRKAGLEPQYDEAALALADVLPSVQDMVRFAVRETYSPEVAERFGQYQDFPGAFAEDARLLGLTPERARQYWAAHWDLPSPEQGFEMFHRGFIDRDDLSLLLRALDVMPFWRDRLIGLAARIPTLPDMIRFALREVWTPAIRQRFGLDDEYPVRFTREAALHGLDEEYARDYWAAHWELPSTEQGFRMRHRDVITDVELNTLLRTKDVMPFWREKLRAITYLVPGRVDLRRMLRAETLTEAQVEEGYRDLGYAPPTARILREFAVAERDGTDVAIAARRVYRRAVIAQAHSEFKAWSLSEADVRSGLARIGIPPRHADELIPLWRAERDLVRTELTAAQVRAALRGGDMSEQDALARLRERGYTEEDAALFLEITARELTPADIGRAYARNAITLEEAQRRLRELGYSDAAALVFLAERRPELTARDIRDALNAEVLDEEAALARLVALGYTPEDAGIFLRSG